MAKTCQVCKEKMSFVEGPYETQGFFMHRKCIKTFVKDPSKYYLMPRPHLFVEQPRHQPSICRQIGGAR